MKRFLSVSEYAEQLNVTEKTVYDKLKGRKLESFSIGNERFIPQGEGCISVCFSNLKGGSAKTTSVINLAALLAKQNMRVLVIDCDSQNHVRYFFKIPDGDHPSVKNIFLDNASIEECIITTEFSNLGIVLGDIILSLQEKQIIDKHLILREKLESLINDYDFILFDNPPALNTYSINSILASDYVVIPAQANFLGFEGITHLVEAINQITSDFPISILGILLTLVEQQLNQSKFFQETIKKTYGNLLFNNVIRKDVRISESSNFGTNIFDYKEKCRGAQDYKAFIIEFLRKVGR